MSQCGALFQKNGEAHICELDEHYGGNHEGSKLSFHNKVAKEIFNAEQPKGAAPVEYTKEEIGELNNAGINVISEKRAVNLREQADKLEKEVRDNYVNTVIEEEKNGEFTSGAREALQEGLRQANLLRSAADVPLEKPLGRCIVNLPNGSKQRCQKILGHTGDHLFSLGEDVKPEEETLQEMKEELEAALEEAKPVPPTEEQLAEIEARKNELKVKSEYQLALTNLQHLNRSRQAIDNPPLPNIHCHNEDIREACGAIFKNQFGKEDTCLVMKGHYGSHASAPVEMHNGVQATTLPTNEQLIADLKEQARALLADLDARLGSPKRRCNELFKENRVLHACYLIPDHAGACQGSVLVHSECEQIFNQIERIKFVSNEAQKAMRIAPPTVSEEDYRAEVERQRAKQCLKYYATPAGFTALCERTMQHEGDHGPWPVAIIKPTPEIAPKEHIFATAEHGKTYRVENHYQDITITVPPSGKETKITLPRAVNSLEQILRDEDKLIDILHALSLDLLSQEEKTKEDIAKCIWLLQSLLSEMEKAEEKALIETI